MSQPKKTTIERKEFTPIFLSLILVDEPLSYRDITNRVKGIKPLEKENKEAHDEWIRTYNTIKRHIQRITNNKSSLSHMIIKEGRDFVENAKFKINYDACLNYIINKFIPDINTFEYPKVPRSNILQKYLSKYLKRQAEKIFFSKVNVISIHELFENFVMGLGFASISKYRVKAPIINPETDDEVHDLRFFYASSEYYFRTKTFNEFSWSASTMFYK